MHPQPQPDEIFSSWLVRLAFENGFKPHTFYNKVLEYTGAVWNRDIDRHPPAELLSILRLHTGQLEPRLKELTLCAYEGLLFEGLPIIGNAPWVLPVGIFHRQRRHAGMQFCPICLQLDRIPYYRKKWRLAFYAICEHHQCLMHDCCPSCRSPIAYHRHGIGKGGSIPNNPLLLCHQCQFDLRRAKPKYLNWPDARSWHMLGATISLFDIGAWDCGTLTPPCGPPFFQGLHVLASTISGRYGYKLRTTIAKLIGYQLKLQKSETRTEIEWYSVEERLELLLICIWLLDEWPNRFTTLFSEVNLTRSRLSDKPDALPYWLADIIKQYLDRRPYLLSEVEIVAAGNSLIRQGRKVTARALGELLDLPRDRSKQAMNIWINSQPQASN